MLDTIRSIPLTFYSRGFYYRLVHGWPGIGMGFLLTLTVFSTICAGVKGYASMQDVGEQIQIVFDAMPIAAIKDGTLSIDAPSSPYSVQLMDLPAAAPEKPAGPDRLVIDTDYRITDIDSLMDKMEKEHILVFVTAHKYILRKQQKDRGIEVHDFSKIPDGTFTHEEWSALGKTIRAWLYPFLLFFIALGVFIIDFFLILVVAVLMKILSLMFSMKTDFAAMMRLAAAGGIPIGIITALIALPFWAKMIVWIGYAGFGLYDANKPGAIRE